MPPREIYWFALKTDSGTVINPLDTTIVVIKWELHRIIVKADSIDEMVSTAKIMPKWAWFKKIKYSVWKEDSAKPILIKNFWEI